MAAVGVALRAGLRIANVAEHLLFARSLLQPHLDSGDLALLRVDQSLLRNVALQPQRQPVRAGRHVIQPVGLTQHFAVERDLRSVGNGLYIQLRFRLRRRLDVLHT